MRKCIAVIGILLFLSLQAASAADQSYPKRIVSLGPAITENIYLLGAEDSLIGTTTYCIRPPEAKTKEKVGTVIELNTEKILSLEPDLVIATALTDQKAIEKLKNLGINVFYFPRPKSFTQICQQFRELAALTGKTEIAESIITAAEKKVEVYRKMAPLQEQVKVFIQVGIKPLFTATADSFMNDFVEFSGGRNIAKEAGTGIYSREEVLRADPDVIIIVTMGLSAENEKEVWKKYKSLNAVKTGRIHIVDPYRFCSPTPLTFVESLEEIYRLLHPYAQ